MNGKHVLLITAVFTAIVFACSPTRIRPGPPRIFIDVQPATDVFSPDTVQVTVTAQDADGLDSVFVSFQGNTFDFVTNFEAELTVDLELLVPSGLPMDTQLPITSRAQDIFGNETNERVVLNVTGINPNQPIGSTGVD